MNGEKINAKVVELPPMPTGEIESHIKSHAARTLGKAVSYYGSTSGFSPIPASMSAESKREFLQRMAGPMQRLREELGFSGNDNSI